MRSYLRKVMKWRYGWLMLLTCFVVMCGQYAYGEIPVGAVPSQSLAPQSLAPQSLESRSLASSVSVPAVNANSGTRVTSAATVDDYLVDDYLDSGQAFYDSGQLNAAISDWEQALALARNVPHQQAIAHNYLAIGHQGLSDWSQADTHIQQGLSFLKDIQDSAFLTAQLLNTQGSLQLQTGQADQALETWQNAIDLYQSIHSGDTTLAIARTRINQALALRVLGFYRRAKTTLDEVQTQLPPSTPTEVKLAVLQSLGETLLRIGDPAQAQVVLSEALTFAHSPEQQATMQLNLAQTLAALGDQPAAIELYQQARTHGTSDTQLEALLKQLALKVEAADDSAFSGAAVSQDLDMLLAQLSVLPPSRWGINSQVYLANLLIDTVGVEQLDSLNISVKAIDQQLTRALFQSRSLRDHQAEASVLGQLGHLYEQTQQWDLALDLTQQALGLMSNSPASYANAQGQWQLARILKAQGAPEKAIAAYSSAVKQLDVLQYDIVALNPDAKFSFRDRIEPVYRGYVELLLTDIQQQSDSPRQQQLQIALDTMESLQLAELQNYFREACLTYQTREIEAIDPHAAIVYPILLTNRIDVIVSVPHQPLAHYSTEIPELDQEQWLRDILGSLHPASPANAIVPFGQQLYSWLLAPVAAQLEQQAIDSLVFVPDSFLRNIPMSILHDGSSYLLERYNLALTPSMQLLNSRPLASGDLKTLTAGLTAARQGFSSLPGVNQEISQIEQLVPADVLLNSQFTKENIFNQSSQREFSIVHLATHGQFSASPEETFLLTWDDRINVKDLGELFQASQRQDQPIELLVLSACQTALGDRQAALGMAGVAIESGARSTVATLWSVQDESTSMVMGEFYRQLIDNQQPRAQALRDAQLMLMKDPIYQHPYYWAPFVMIGNWQ